MKNPIAILVGVMVVGLAAFLLLSRNPNRVESKAKMLSVDSTTVNYIRVKNNDGDIQLKKVGAHWRIASPFDFPANETYVKSLIDKAIGLEYESLVSKNREKFDQYELGDSAVYVEIGVEGGKIDKIYSGKPSETYTHTYMRREGSDEIWLVSGTPKSAFSRRPMDWRDKKVFELDRTMVTKILLKFPDETLELVRQISAPTMDTTLSASDTSWMVNTPKGESFRINQKPFNRIMNTVTRINAVDFKDAPIDTMPDFNKPEFSVEVFLEGNQHEVLDFVPNKAGDGSRWFGRKNGNEQTLYLIYQSSVKNLMKRVPELKTGEEPPKPADPRDKKKYSSTI